MWIGTSKRSTHIVKKIRLKSPNIRSVAATSNDVPLVVCVAFFMCSILNKSPPIADGRKIDPYADRTYPLVASIMFSLAIGRYATVERIPPTTGRRAEITAKAVIAPKPRFPSSALISAKSIR